MLNAAYRGARRIPKCATLVVAVDAALVTNYPVAGVIPASLRRRVIRNQLQYDR